MSWFSNIVNNAAGWGGEDPEAVRQRQAAVAAAAAKAQADAEAAAQATAASTATATAANRVPPPYAGPSGAQKLEALLPPGFDASMLPSDFGAGNIESAISKGRGTAQDFISNMLKRGTLTPGGAGLAGSNLGTQETGLRSRLSGVRDAMVANERAGLRGIANEGYTAGQGQTGEFFDPAPYQQRVNTELGRFTSGFPDQFTSGGGTADFDLNALQSSGGGVSGSQNVALDPYAVEGGKLSAGIAEPAPGKKKRTTSVF